MSVALEMLIMFITYFCTFSMVLIAAFSSAAQMTSIGLLTWLFLFWSVSVIILIRSLTLFCPFFMPSMVMSVSLFLLSSLVTKSPAWELAGGCVVFVGVSSSLVTRLSILSWGVSIDGFGFGAF